MGTTKKLTRCMEMSHRWIMRLDESSKHMNTYTQRTLFEILLNQTEIRLYLPLTDWFGTDNGEPSDGTLPEHLQFGQGKPSELEPLLERCRFLYRQYACGRDACWLCVCPTTECHIFRPRKSDLCIPLSFSNLYRDFNPHLLFKYIFCNTKYNILMVIIFSI